MQLSDFGVDRQQSNLQDGTPVIVYHRPDAPISLRVAFLSGSRFDPPGKEGLAHFAEHMAFTGTQKLPSRLDIAKFIEAKGAYYNASTGQEAMTIKLDFPEAADTADMVNLIADLIQHTTMSPETIEQERGTILSEMTRSKANPGRYVSFLWHEIALQGTPMGRSIIGTESSLASLNQDDIKDYFANMLQSNRAIIVASGGITASELVKILEQTPIMASSPNRFKPDPIKPTVTEAIQVAKYPESSHAHLTLGLPAATMNHPKFQELKVLARILATSQTSRLRQKLRNELGLVYAIGSGVAAYSSTGHLLTATDCHVDNVQQVLDVITKEISDIKANGVTDEELDHVKSSLAKSQKMALQTSDEWADYHTGRELIFPELNSTIVDDFNQIATITTADVQQAANDLLDLNGYTLAICGDLSASDVSVNF